ASERFARPSKIFSKQEGGLVFLGRALFITLLFENRAEQVVCFERWRLLDGRGGKITAHKSGRERQIAVGAQQRGRGIDQHFGLIHGRVGSFLQSILHFVEPASLWIEKRQVQ